MSVTLVLGLVAVAGAILLGAVALLSPSPRPDGAAKALLASPPARPTYDPDQLPALLDRLRTLAGKLTPSGYQQRLQRRLDVAGNPPAWPAARVLAFKGAALVFGGLFGLLLGRHGGIGLLAWPAALGAAGFFVPDLLIHNIGEKRQDQLLKGLPDALDMMTVCVEAGLGFDAALSRVATTLEGPMAAECARVLQEMQFGKSRTDALRALAERTAVTELRTFVSALVQAAELGISVGVVLREQAKEMRIRRRQRAEETAQKLPVKILLPLVMCLLPAMFIVILGPAIINIIHTLGALNGH